MSSLTVGLLPRGPAAWRTSQRKVEGIDSDDAFRTTREALKR